MGGHTCDHRRVQLATTDLPAVPRQPEVPWTAIVARVCTTFNAQPMAKRDASAMIESVWTIFNPLL